MDMEDCFKPKINNFFESKREHSREAVPEKTKNIGSCMKHITQKDWENMYAWWGDSSFWCTRDVVLVSLHHQMLPKFFSRGYTISLCSLMPRYRRKCMWSISLQMPLMINTKIMYGRILPSLQWNCHVKHISKWLATPRPKDDGI